MNKNKNSKNYLKILAVVGGLFIATSAFADTACPTTCHDHVTHTTREHCRDQGNQNFVSKLLHKTPRKCQACPTCGTAAVANGNYTYNTSDAVPVTSRHITKVSLDDIKKNLVKPMNDVFVSQSLPNVGIDYYVVYFSGSACEPCDRVTSEIVKFYNSTKSLNSNFEVVLVSYDPSETAMLNYMKKESMPWYAVKYSAKDNLDVFQKVDISAIPTLLVFNSNGELVYQGTGVPAVRNVIDQLKSVVR